MARNFEYSLLCSILITCLSFLKGVSGYECPYDYPFYSCPRPGDPMEWTTCCRVNGYAQCCDTTALAVWAIWVVVVTCFLFSVVFAIIICACCPCCWLASRRRRTQYTVVTAGDAPVYPAPSTTSTTYVYPTPPTTYGTPQPPAYNPALQPAYNPAQQPAFNPSGPSPAYVPAGPPLKPTQN